MFQTIESESIISDPKDNDWYYSLHWIIIRQVRRRRDMRYMFTFPNTNSIPETFYEYYDTNNCHKETHQWGAYWRKNDEKMFMSKLMVDSTFKNK